MVAMYIATMGIRVLPVRHLESLAAALCDDWFRRNRAKEEREGDGDCAQFWPSRSGSDESIAGLAERAGRFTVEVEIEAGLSRS